LKYHKNDNPTFNIRLDYNISDIYKNITKEQTHYKCSSTITVVTGMTVLLILPHWKSVHDEEALDFDNYKHIYL
jgi:hypothetical protein